MLSPSHRPPSHRWPLPASLLALLVPAALWSVRAQPPASVQPPRPAIIDGFALSSPGTREGGALPTACSCDGESKTPELSWTAPPAGTRSLALAMSHVPGPGDRHVYWVLYNLPATARALDAATLAAAGKGLNTVNRRPQYAPPCSQGPGRKWYTLTLYALSGPVPLAANATPTLEQLETAMKGLELGQAVLNLSYERQFSANASTGSTPPRPGTPNLARVPAELLRRELSLDEKQSAQLAKMEMTSPSSPNPAPNLAPNTAPAAAPAGFGRQAEGAGAPADGRDRERAIDEAIRALLTPAQIAALPRVFALMEAARNGGIPTEVLPQLQLTAAQNAALLALQAAADGGPAQLPTFLTAAQVQLVEEYKRAHPRPQPRETGDGPPR